MNNNQVEKLVALVIMSIIGMILYVLFTSIGEDKRDCEGMKERLKVETAFLDGTCYYKKDNELVSIKNEKYIKKEKECLNLIESINGYGSYFSNNCKILTKENGLQSTYDIDSYSYEIKEKNDAI